MIRILIVIGERGGDCGNKDGGNDIEEEEGEDGMSLLGCHSKMSFKRDIPMRNRRESLAAGELVLSFFRFYSLLFFLGFSLEKSFHNFIDSEQTHCRIFFADIVLLLATHDLLFQSSKRLFLLRILKMFL